MVYIFILIFNESILDGAQSTDKLPLLLPPELSMLDKKKREDYFFFFWACFSFPSNFLSTSWLLALWNIFVTCKNDKVTLGQGSLYSHAMKMTGELEKGQTLSDLVNSNILKSNKVKVLWSILLNILKFEGNCLFLPQDICSVNIRISKRKHFSSFFKII